MLLPSEAKHALTGNSEKKPLSTLPYKETAVRGTSATVKHYYVFYDFMTFCGNFKCLPTCHTEQILIDLLRSQFYMLTLKMDHPQYLNHS